MVGRAAGHDVHRVQPGNFFFGKADARKINLSVLADAADGVLHRPGLLVDFLHHEVLVAALFGSLGVPLDFGQGLFDDVAVQIVEGDVAAGQPGHFHVAHVIDIPGVLQNGGYVGG